MTNGEKIKEIFPSMIVGFITESQIGVYFVKNQNSASVFSLDWWNSEYKEPTLEVQKAIEIIKADSLAPYSVNEILSARDLAVEALKQMTTTKKASEEAYRRGYLDCSEKLRSFQKLHDEERELKDKLNKIDIEDAWKCGFEQGVKHEKLGRTDICPHYIRADRG